jgi:hypothetical protein
MGLFEKLHRPGSNSIISPEIDQFLLDIGYSNDGNLGDKRAFSQHYFGKGDGAYTTIVTISAERIFFYEEYNCGGEIDRCMDDIPREALNGSSEFEEFLSEIFDRRSWLFDDSIKKQFERE